MRQFEFIEWFNSLCKDGVGWLSSFFQILVNADPCGSLSAAAVVLFVGKIAVGNHENQRRFGAALGGLVFLIAFVAVVRRTGEPLDAAFKSVVWGGVTVGSSWVCTAVACAVFQHAVYAPFRWLADRVQAAERDRTARLHAEAREREKQLEHEQYLARIAADAAARPKPPPPPPMPTRAERIAAAKAKYDETVRALEGAGLGEVELAAAKEQAHQRYVLELDVAMAR